MQSLSRTCASERRSLSQLTAHQRKPEISLQSAYPLNAGQVIRFLSTGLNKGVAKIMEITGSYQDMFDFSDLAKILLQKLVSRGDQKFITVNVDLFDIRFAETETCDPILLSVNEMSVVLSTKLLNELQHNLLTDVISSYENYPLTTFEYALTIILIDINNHNADLIRTAVKHLLKVSDSLKSQELKFAAANYLLQHESDFSTREMKLALKMIIISSGNCQQMTVGEATKQIITGKHYGFMPFKCAAIHAVTHSQDYSEEVIQIVTLEILKNRNEYPNIALAPIALQFIKKKSPLLRGSDEETKSIRIIF